MNTKNLPLVIGIALPLVFIVIISVIVFLPSFFVKPQHDFLYSSIDNGYYGYNQGYKNTYKVEKGRIVLEPLPVVLDPTLNKELVNYKGERTPLYLYDVETNTSHQISFEEAQDLMLDPGPSAPDGYTVEYNYGHDGIFELFGSNNNNNGYFISKGNAKKKLVGLTNDGNYYWYQGNFKLIGWVK